MAAVSFILAMLFRAGDVWSPENTDALIVGTAIFAGLSALVFFSLSLHKSIWRWSSTADQMAVARAATLAVFLFVPTMFMIGRLEGIGRSVPLIQWFVLVTLLSGSRFFYRWYISRQGGRSTFRQRTPVLLLGTGEGAAIYLHALDAIPGSAFYAVGMLCDRGELMGRSLNGVPVLGSAEDLDHVLVDLETHGIFAERLIVTKPLESLPAGLISRLGGIARRHGVDIDTLPDLLSLRLGGGGVIASADEPMPIGAPRWLEIKRLLDIITSAGLLLFTAPIALLAAFMVLVEMGNPVLFRQVRPGHGLRPFTLLKFRSMRSPRAADGRLLSDAERTGMVGRFLRRTRFDEIPQLVNILKGDMSFIGPRPLLPRDLADLPDGGWERARLRPGLTGWAQVNGGHQLTNPDKMALDLWYTRHASPWLDMKIILMTTRMVIFGEQVNQAAIDHARAWLRNQGATYEENSELDSHAVI
ncbi:MAG TPA: sugar transferase [Geminicoccus sp.]|uniref:sugar transferase n=1 Tax=Geminicoccus sp. TaxID=2024832 RepID=UPI002E31B05C|nr:sugar transferase [Geminicoccus sp.]HEX2525912.1 sugar transferase [Geminicoccus sp.]